MERKTIIIAVSAGVAIAVISAVVAVVLLRRPGTGLWPPPGVAMPTVDVASIPSDDTDTEIVPGAAPAPADPAPIDRLLTEGELAQMAYPPGAKVRVRTVQTNDGKVTYPQYVVEYLPPDADQDKLTDDQERSLGTDPQKKDTDGDGLDDADEVREKTDPLDTDSDDNGITDGVQYATPKKRG